MINKSLAKLHKFHGEQVFLEAQRALLTPPRKTFRLIASYGVAAVLLLLPVLAIGFGLWALAFDLWVWDIGSDVLGRGSVGRRLCARAATDAANRTVVLTG